MLLDHLRNRRSIRRFSEVPVPKQIVDRIKETAVRVPSSRGKMPWQFVFIEDQDLLKKVSTSKMHGSAFLGNAPLAVVVLADPEVSDVWVEDASIAAISIQYAAESYGLGACWVQIRKRKHSSEISSETFLKRILKVPETIQVLSIIGIGYSDESKPPHSVEEIHFDKIHTDYFGSSC